VLILRHRQRSEAGRDRDQKFAQDDKVLAIIGHFSGEAAVTFQVGERLGIIELLTSATTPGLTKASAMHGDWSAMKASSSRD
jgi:ABC-type branched-subunit amino acid transport system substrate-binding protein